MQFVATIQVMPLAEILDPQGKAVLLGLQHLHIQHVQDVRIGRSIRIVLEAATEQEASQKIDLACLKLLANPIMEGYTYSLETVA